VLGELAQVNAQPLEVVEEASNRDTQFDVPTRVSSGRCRYPLRRLVRSGGFGVAPQRPSALRPRHSSMSASTKVLSNERSRFG
jgi:hypothetical protein